MECNFSHYFNKLSLTHITTYKNGNKYYVHLITIIVNQRNMN